jgi:hypothetical protein
MKYESILPVESTTYPGVRFTISRMSFGRRIELARRIREIAHKLEFARAADNPRDTLDAALISGEVDQICLEWGLVQLDGLEIDGRIADPQDLIASGPEKLCREVVDAIKRECGLTEEERKN